MPSRADTADRRLLRTATRRQHAIKYGIFAVVVLAAIGGIGQLWSLGSAAIGMFGSQSGQTATTASADDTARVGDFAIDWVKTFLSATKSNSHRLAAFYTGEVSLSDTPIDATDAQLASLPEPQPGPAANLQQWSVVVSVAQRDSADSLQRRRIYYQVTIVVLDGTRLRASTLPAVVSPVWSTGVDVSLDYETPVDDGDPSVVAITGFLRALLAGGPDMSRYIAAGYPAHPLTPPPFQAITVTNVRAQAPASSSSGGPQQVRMLATIQGTRAFSTVPMQYPLRLVVTDGRWEVAGIELFPALGTKATDPPPSTDAAPASTASNPNPTPTDSVFGKP